MTKRFSGWSLMPTLAVLAALFAAVHVHTKALHTRLLRVKDAHGLGLGWLDAFRLSGTSVYPIAGGATLTEGQHTGEFVVSEANGTRSREKITVLSGQNLKALQFVPR